MTLFSTIFKTDRRSPARSRSRGGFTLVELVVAAVILAVAIVTLVGVMRYMRREQNLDYHRRQARSVINRTFENVFAFTFYPGPYTFQDRFVSAGFVNEGTDDEEELWEAVSVSVDASTPVHVRVLDGVRSGFDLDRRGGDFPPCPAKMEVKLERVEVTVSGEPIITHLITLTVTWTEIGETTPESVTLTKRLAPVL